MVSPLAAIAIERKHFEDPLAYQALHDPLTGLPNRVLFVDLLELALRPGSGPAPRSRCSSSTSTGSRWSTTASATTGRRPARGPRRATRTGCGRATPWPGSAATSSPSCATTPRPTSPTASRSTSPSACRRDQRAVRARRRGAVPRRQHRHRDLAHGPRPSRGAPARRRRGDVPRQGARPRPLRAVRRAAARPRARRLETENALHRAVAARRAACLLPADHRAARRDVRRRRSAGALAAPRTGLLIPTSSSTAEETGLIVPIGAGSSKNRAAARRVRGRCPPPTASRSWSTSRPASSCIRSPERVAAVLGEPACDPAPVVEITESVLMDDTTRSSRPSTRWSRTAFASASTTSAPATRRSATCSGSRSTTSRSTARSSTARHRERRLRDRCGGHRPRARARAQCRRGGRGDGAAARRSSVSSAVTRAQGFFFSPPQPAADLTPASSSARTPGSSAGTGG